MKTQENTNKICEIIHNKVCNNSLNHAILVQIIELCEDYLKLKTISNYAKENELSYNGVKNNRTIKELFGAKFVIDND